MAIQKVYMGCCIEKKQDFFSIQPNRTIQVAERAVHFMSSIAAWQQPHDHPHPNSGVLPQCESFVGVLLQLDWIKQLTDHVESTQTKNQTELVTCFTCDQSKDWSSDMVL